MQELLRSSELWVGLASAVGQIGVTLGWWTQEHFNSVLMPAIVYVVARVTSKTAKAVIPPATSTSGGK